MQRLQMALVGPPGNTRKPTDASFAAKTMVALSRIARSERTSNNVRAVARLLYALAMADDDGDPLNYGDAIGDIEVFMEVAAERISVVRSLARAISEERHERANDTDPERFPMNDNNRKRLWGAMLGLDNEPRVGKGEDMTKKALIGPQISVEALELLRALVEWANGPEKTSQRDWDEIGNYFANATGRSRVRVYRHPRVASAVLGQIDEAILVADVGNRASRFTVVVCMAPLTDKVTWPMHPRFVYLKWVESAPDPGPSPTRGATSALSRLLRPSVAQPRPRTPPPVRVEPSGPKPPPPAVPAPSMFRPTVAEKRPRPPPPAEPVPPRSRPGAAAPGLPSDADLRGGEMIDYDAPGWGDCLLFSVIHQIYMRKDLQHLRLRLDEVTSIIELDRLYTRAERDRTRWAEDNGIEIGPIENVTKGNVVQRLRMAISLFLNQYDPVGPGALNNLDRQVRADYEGRNQQTGGGNPRIVHRRGVYCGPTAISVLSKLLDVCIVVAMQGYRLGDPNVPLARDGRVGVRTHTVRTPHDVADPRPCPIVGRSLIIREFGEHFHSIVPAQLLVSNERAVYSEYARRTEFEEVYEEYDIERTHQISWDDPFEYDPAAFGPDVQRSGE